MTAPMTSREALHPTQMSNQELAGALDDYRHWTVLEETTQDLLNAASQRLRAVAATPPSGLRDMVAKFGRFAVDAPSDSAGAMREAANNQVPTDHDVETADAAPDLFLTASHNSGERDPSVMPDWDRSGVSADATLVTRPLRGGE